MARSLCRWLYLASGLTGLLLLQLIVRPAYAGATEWMDIHVADGRLLLESEISGIAGYSMIDTGAQLSAVNARFLESEGLSFKKGRKVQVSGAFSKSLRNTYRAIPAVIFGLPINCSGFVEVTLDNPDIQLLLGAAFLEPYIFQFDYPNGRMRLITRDSVDLEAIKNIESKRNPETGQPMVRVGLDEKTEVWLTMDTGATGGIFIDRDLADRMGWIDTYAKEEHEDTGVNSSGRMEHFRVPAIKFGVFKIANPDVSIPVFGESFELFATDTPIGTRIANRSISKGLLGYDILKHFVVTIDYKSGYVHIYPGEKTPAENE